MSRLQTLLSKSTCAAKAWSRGGAPCPPSRTGHSAVVHGGSMWIYGGVDDNGDSVAGVFAMDLSTGVWRRAGAYTRPLLSSS